MLYQVGVQLHKKHKTTPVELLLLFLDRENGLPQGWVADVDSSFLFHSVVEGGSGLDSVHSQA